MPPNLFLRRANHFQNLSENCFRRHARCSKDNFSRLLEIFGEELAAQPRAGGVRELAPSQTLCLTLSAWGSTSFQITTALLGGISQSTAWKYIHQVADIITARKPEFIHAPNRFEMADTARRMLELHHLPNFSYAVDGTFAYFCDQPRRLPPGNLMSNHYWGLSTPMKIWA